MKSELMMEDIQQALDENHEDFHELHDQISEDEKMAYFARYNPNPVIRIDNYGKVLISNKSANVYFKIEKMRGLHWNDLVDMNRAKIDTSKGNLRFEYNLHGKDLLLCYSPVPEIEAINIYGFDISERKKMEKELEEERARHLHSSKMATLGEMAGGMAHELNTPLGLLSLSLNQLEKSFDNRERAEDIILEMEKTIQRMAKLINGFKTFSRSKDDDEFSFTSFKFLYEDSMQLCQMSLKNKGILFTFDECVEDVSIECNASRISQVIMNLVQNAADAIKKQDEEKRWIKVQLEVADELIVSVTDSGTGIPEDIVEKIFIPFYTTKDVGEGTGLGLGIIKGIIDKHNGNVFVDTKCENTCFRFSLPLIQSIGDFL